MQHNVNGLCWVNMHGRLPVPLPAVHCCVPVRTESLLWHQCQAWVRSTAALACYYCRHMSSLVACYALEIVVWLGFGISFVCAVCSGGGACDRPGVRCKAVEQ
jgi:hypothetical protein